MVYLLGNELEQEKTTKNWCSRLSKDETAEFLTKTRKKERNARIRKTYYCSMDVVYVFRSICKKNICF